MINHHPNEELLLEYATGSLAPAPCISITTHLQYCDHCKHSVESLSDIGGELLDTCIPEAASENLFDRIIDELDQAPWQQSEESVSQPQTPVKKYHDIPTNVARLIPSSGLQWQRLSKGLKVAPLSVGETKNELALHRIEAGGKAPTHNHLGQEITVVLKGSFSDELGVYQPGDFIIREPGESHGPVGAQQGECICLSVLAAPIQLTGVKRIFNPFLKFSPC